MKIKVNTKVIAELNPCKDRFDNWKKHYGKVNIDILQFLNLDKIKVQDKLWVTFRLIPRDLVETFAFDCAVDAAVSAAYAADVVNAADASDASYDAANALDATYAATYAADAAADANAADAADYAASAAYSAADAKAAARERQLDALAYLISTYKKVVA